MSLQQSVSLQQSAPPQPTTAPRPTCALAIALSLALHGAGLLAATAWHSPPPVPAYVEVDVVFYQHMPHPGSAAPVLAEGPALSPLPAIAPAPPAPLKPARTPPAAPATVSPEAVPPATVSPEAVPPATVSPEAVPLGAVSPAGVSDEALVDYARPAYAFSGAGGAEGGAPGAHLNPAPHAQSGAWGGPRRALQVIPFGEGMSHPKLLREAHPIRFSREALAARVEGRAVVRCTITAGGRVENCRFIQALPYMEEAILSALYGRTYAPATFQGKNISVDYNIPIRLKLP